MDYYLKSVNKAIEFIEQNLSEQITLADVSQVACFSSFHFHRIFLARTGCSVSEYIKKRRLTKAAKMLINSDKRILDIALDSFFESQEAFSRAFFKLFGKTPGAYRKQKLRLITLEKQELTKGVIRHLYKGVIMEPKIVKKDSFTVIGMLKKVTLKTASVEIPKLWEKFNKRSVEIKNRIPGEAYGLCEYTDLSDFTEDTPYTELTCLAVTKVEDIPAGMISKKVPAATYAVFTHKGKVKNIQKTYNYIYNTWLPKSGYKWAAQDDFELYNNRFLGADSDESEIYIYLPIEK